MTSFTSGNLSHDYVYGNHRKYPTVFGKLRKCLKTVSDAFLDFLKFSKSLRKFSDSKNQHPGNRSKNERIGPMGRIRILTDTESTNQNAGNCKVI